MSNLLDKASIVTTPTAYDNGKILSVKPTDGTGDFDFTRNSSATRVNSQGLIEDITSNLPRIDYTGGEGHWLFEPQSTNLVQYSSDFTPSRWVKNNTLNSNIAISPSGLLDASKITCTTNGYNYIFNNFAPPSGNYTNSIFLKKDASSGWVALRIWAGGGANGVSVWFDLDNSEIGTSSSNVAGFTLTNATSEYFGNDWYRLSVSGTTDSSSYLSLNFVDGDGLNTYTNVSGKSCFIWGAQSEVQTYATSIIPTSGSTITRLQDAAFGAGSSDLINSTEGVLYAEISIDTTLGVGSDITLIDSSNTADFIRFTNDGGTNKVNMYFRYNGVSNFHTFIGDTTIFKKYAIQWGNGEVNYYVNGVLKETDFTTMPTLNVFDKLHLSRTGSSNRAFTGKVKALAVFKEALTDAELTCLTTI